MDKSHSEKHFTHSIVFRISMLFAVMAVIVIAVCGIGNFMIQVDVHEKQSIVQMRHLGTMLREEIKMEDDVFLAYQEYMLKNSDSIEIPYDFDHAFVDQAKERFDRAFTEQYPGQAFGADVGFEELPDDLKRLFCTYYHAKWFLYFEDVRSWFDVPYTYYVYPNGVGTNIVHIHTMSPWI